MSQTTPFRVSDLPQNSATAFDLRPSTTEMAALADALGVSALRKLSFRGDINAHGKRDWQLTGRLGATVVQPCVVTLAPVTTRIDADVNRLFVDGMALPDVPETEMPEDDSQEPLGTHIDPAAVMAEALSLALPQYPRVQDAELDTHVFTEPGKAAMTDNDVKPFAGLADLRNRMNKEE